MLKKTILTKQPIRKTPALYKDEGPLIDRKALDELPWRKELNIPQYSPIGKTDIILATARARLSSPPSDWRIFYNKLKYNIFTSALMLDIDGTIIKNQSQTNHDKLKTLRDGDNRVRLEQLFALASCGFPLFFASGNSRKRQQKVAIDPLVDYAKHYDLLPALNGIGLFSDSVTNFARLNNRGTFIENHDYSQHATIPANALAILKNILKNFQGNFQSRIFTDVNNNNYPDFKLKLLRIENKNGKRLLFHPIPSWRYNDKFWHKDPDQRLDLRSIAIRELKNLLQKNQINNIDVIEGGKTTIEFVVTGINKSLPLQYLLDKLPYSFVIYAGDEFFPGGNDYPVYKYLKSISYGDPHHNRVAIIPLCKPTYNPMDSIYVIKAGQDETFSSTVFDLYLHEYNIIKLNCYYPAVIFVANALLFKHYSFTSQIMHPSMNIPDRWW
ncbi:MAG: hypothetical protein ABIH39_01480 [Candidatus Margulisiibacteriota bacterium]